MIVCTICQDEIYTRFCTHCGAEGTNTDKSCPSCGKSVNLYDSYCGNCGKFQRKFTEDVMRLVKKINDKKDADYTWWP